MFLGPDDPDKVASQSLPGKAQEKSQIAPGNHLIGVNLQHKPLARNNGVRPQTIQFVARRVPDKSGEIPGNFMLIFVIVARLRPYHFAGDRIRHTVAALLSIRNFQN